MNCEAQEQSNIEKNVKDWRINNSVTITIMQNDNISSYLFKYIEYKDPQYAVMLTGAWGCGKTYFIKGWKKSVELLKDKKCKPLYISLYGMHTMTELRDSINRQLHPILTSAFVKNAKKIALGLASAAVKYNLGNEQKPVEVSCDLDLIPLFQEDNKEIASTGKILIFDDVERCHINRVELLGFLNFFVEHCACKVIVLCNESRMLVQSGKRIICKEPVEDIKDRWVADIDNQKIQDAEYREFKEKTIGITFEVKPDIEAAIDKFIESIASDPRELLKNMKPYLKELLEKTNNNNLRVLRQCFLDFSSIVKNIPTHLYKSELYVPVMRKFLLDLVITSYEVKAGNALFDNLDYLEYSFLPGDKYNSFTSLVTHYSSVPEKLGIQILDYESVKNAVGFIRTGYYPINLLITSIGQKESIEQPWDKLTYFWNLTNQEFLANYELTAQKIESHKVNNIDELVGIIFKLVNFDYMEIKKASPTLKRDAGICLRNMIRGINTLDDMMKFKRGLVGRLNYYYFDQEAPLWKDIISTFIQDTDKKIHKCKSRMSEILENLSADNLVELAKLIDSNNPITGRSYTQGPIFDQVSPTKVVTGIFALPNKDRTLFADILSHHFEALNTSNYHEFNFYEPERNKVSSIAKKLKQVDLSMIDKYSVNMIVKQFEKFLLLK